MNRSQRKRAAKKEGSFENQVRNRIKFIRDAFLEDLFQDETKWTYKELFQMYDEKWRDFASHLNMRQAGLNLDPEAFSQEFKPLEAPKTRFRIWLT